MSWFVRPIKYAVSGTRYRHIEGNYDLDLAYITNRIIAMGFPGDGIEGVYRNDGQEIARFLKEKHNGHYMIWNLSEKPYGHEKFDNQVLEFGFPDHHNPPLDLLFAICKSIDSWLKADAQNVAAVHCLAGKGRTGCVIAAYLLYVGLQTDPIEALAYFAQKRSYERATPKQVQLKDSQAVSYILSLGGVNSPSQVRYVQYFHRVLTTKMLPQRKVLHLKKFYIRDLSPLLKRQLVDGIIVLNIFEMVSTGPNTVERKLLFTTTRIDRIDVEDLVVFSTDLDIAGDILITCYNKNALRDEKVFRFAFHTGFVPDENILELRKCDMDEACHNKTPYIPERFKIDLMFDTRSEEPKIEETEEEEKVSHDHLYAKTDPNTRNHILLEFTEDGVNNVIKRKLASPQPITVNNVPPVTGIETAIIQPAVQVVEKKSPRVRPVSATYAPLVTPAVEELKAPDSPKTLTGGTPKKPDILVLVVPSNDESRPISVKFRIKRQK